MADDQDYEATLFDDEDPIGGDLKEKVAEAWRDFARHLVDALRGLDAGTTLDLTLDPTASGTGDAIYSVQVTGEDGRHALPPPRSATRTCPRPIGWGGPSSSQTVALGLVAAGGGGGLG